jgi:threonine dehydrogenase-like Zn-dependent dehydrogenase
MARSVRALVVAAAGEVILAERAAPVPAVGCGHCAGCSRGLTNLCQAYDEIGFTRDGAAVGQMAVPAALVHPLAAGRRGGTVVLLGLPPHGDTAALAVDDAVNNDLTIMGSFGYTSSAWRAVVTLLNAGRLRPGFLVTHRFALADFRQAIVTLRGTRSPRGKVLLRVQER